ncbi:phosphopentomutase [Crassaminicella indica]|uniref:phosphopentomutase n=1 Tax=Crassaminicella indica TaxID=2855394 RepID=UPI0021041FE6|nr:phosphopentomutase [Crassaminicella indica]
MNRVIWIVLDSVGMGALPDAQKYGDEGSNTIGNVSKALGGLNIPNMEKIGLGHIDGIKGVKKVENPIGCYGRFSEKSEGKDTTTGHWEMCGVCLEKPFPTYPNGFPNEIVTAFQNAIGTKIIGNKPASGTAIIEELGKEHIKTGYPIVYTSADSVFQIAAHEEVIPLERLYEMCTIARNILKGEHGVARVIARPFIGEPGNFTRTANRRDFSLVPPHDTLLDHLKNEGFHVMAVGKIEDIFSNQGITEAIHTKDNMDGIDQTLNYMKQDKKGLIFTNLVDFDMKWGHRNDVKAYGKGLEEFDKRLAEILDAMKDTDILFITADHGCDPTMPGTDHSREYVPFLAYGKALKENHNLKTRQTFSDMGQTIAEIFNVSPIKNGTSFLKEIIHQ